MEEEGKGKGEWDRVACAVVGIVDFMIGYFWKITYKGKEGKERGRGEWLWGLNGRVRRKGDVEQGL